MRCIALFLTVALLAAACAEETVTPSTTTVAMEEPSTTTTVTEATTTGAAGPVDICQGRPVIWESGRTYVASCFLLSWSAVAPGEGWRTPLFDNDFVLVTWIDPADSSFRANAAVTVGTDSVQERLDEIDDDERIVLVDSGSTVVEGRDARWVDLDAQPFEVTGEGIDRECARDSMGGVVIDGGMEFGYSLVPFGSGGEFFGVGACDRVRVWVFEVDDRTITIIGGTADPERHDEAVAKIEELLEGMSFEVGAGS